MSEKNYELDCDSLPLWERPYAGIPHLREPDEETEDYPGLVVHDGRVTGSITAGRSRLPLWCFVGEMIRRGWARVKRDRDITEIDKESLASFIYFLLEHRGDFGRLLCVLADVERQSSEAETKSETFSWWYHPEMKARVRAALQRCIDSLDAPPPTLEPLTLNVTEVQFDGGKGYGAFIPEAPTPQKQEGRVRRRTGGFRCRSAIGRTG